MIKRAENKRRFPGFWAAPGGHVDDGEDALHAAIREVKEETGVAVGEKEIRLRAVALHHHLDLKEIYLCFVFSAAISAGLRMLVDTAEGEARWLPIASLPRLEKLFPPVKYYLNHLFFTKAPGILYTSIRWRNNRLVKVLSRQLDKGK